jgi:hypothetical protein
MSKLVNSREIAYKWLAGDDYYLWTSKNTHIIPGVREVARLHAEGDGSTRGTWVHRFTGNYWGLLQEELAGARGQVSEKIVQIVGRVASTARALDVAVQLAKSGQPDFEQFEAVNAKNLSQLRGRLTQHNVPRIPDWQNPDFLATRLGQTFVSMGLPFVEGSVIPDTSVRLAHRLSLRGLDMFSGVIEAALSQGVPTPDPGHFSGVIKPWDHTAVPLVPITAQQQLVTN